MLYAFLEGVLKAPKIFSKVELNAATTPFGRESDSVASCNGAGRDDGLPPACRIYMVEKAHGQVSANGEHL